VRFQKKTNLESLAGRHALSSVFVYIRWLVIQTDPLLFFLLGPPHSSFLGFDAAEHYQENVTRLNAERQK